MIVACKECGKKYQIDVSKIKSKSAKFQCRSCGQVVTLYIPTAKSEILKSKDPGINKTPPRAAYSKSHPQGFIEKIKDKSFTARRQKDSKKNTGIIGLRGKLLCFLLLPLISAFAIDAFFSLKQMIGLGDLLTGQSLKMVRQLAEREIDLHARSAATAVRLYLLSHPELKESDFNKDIDFRRIAVQEVGATGHTTLYKLPKKNGVWKTLADVNPKIVGIDMRTLKKKFGRNFSGFWKIYTAVDNGKVSKGYYVWQDDEDTFRDKYMVCRSVEDTPYIVASTTYVDEFTLPVKRLERSSKKLSLNAKNASIYSMVATVLIIGLIVYFYGKRLTGNIRAISMAADKISMGDLNAKIKVKSRDEIGELVEAIKRMQVSLHVAINMLHKPKK